ncbi:hypothetical protein HJC23_002792 [Cyclotella cryptica]|uniref:PPM-type phosphatase domain-containing protein n=1 Tax=Cyclotella cryptica TaxID=29204 RepID=A0ABD3PMK0_9STRA|eukprot:CCRYP_013050-RA/>CCRYP_013050-RA protein AED:0.32 eAED:0.32 QI:401/1/1/1/1/1/3/1200/505
MGCTSSAPLSGSTDRTMTGTETERLMKGRVGIDKTERIHNQSGKYYSGQKNDKSKSLPPPQLNEKGQLTAEEVAKRRSGSVETKDVVLGDVRSEDGVIYATYAVMTQRGYHPDMPHKENQDTYHITPTKFALGEGDALFAVFDGHGQFGHECSAFAETKFPSLLAHHIKKARVAKNAARMKGNPQKTKEPGAFHPRQWPYLSVEEYEQCCREACLGCNRAMHEDSKVGDTMSGTTAIAVSFHAGRITITNVGDSRAILGYRVDSEILPDTPHEEEKKEIGDYSELEEGHKCLVSADGKKLRAGDLVAIALSEDQTPYRKDERARLKNAGARVCTIDQMDGIEPMHENWGELDVDADVIPRVWCGDHNYPGTAFSRSLGDSVAEDVGVNAEPEILTKRVTKGDEILVIASDGIFEFLTNQRIIDICAQCVDPLHACSRLVEASYEKWLEQETRTDDITCIVLFMSSMIPNDIEVMKDLIRQKHQVMCVEKKMYRESLIPSMPQDNS